MAQRRRIVIAITGASGSILGIRLLRNLPDAEKHVVLSEGSIEVMEYETGMTREEVASLADHSYKDSDLSAPISSGSFIYDAMCIVPCSGSTLAKISAGIADTLITRSAAVALKERRKLIIVPRETPFSTLFIENMLRLSRSGAIIAPAMPGYYSRPKSADDMTDFVVGRILDLLGIENRLVKRWEGTE
ncbi:MAG: UbiX family flavin prenyltransferase [Candidatus Thermoplasmatota archaeon]|jgi:4-hydroxy-3-polyprenylbenzoate decarboxylase|nr:UbiX family flavin prenyltransferase [Candidatus Thermoplasmatota archaeon]MCL5786259.1 UbiX family flavin prenyltransferase [Candidatus Thermoplasmatota archaeon]